MKKSLINIKAIALFLILIVSSFCVAATPSILEISASPTIAINFAGNLEDFGGPYWQPPGETVGLSGNFYNGYYTNSSQQIEDWMYINISVYYPEVGVDTVWLQWLNETKWTNWTYSFSYAENRYYEINTSGLIPTSEGYHYSFDVVVNFSNDETYSVGWMKTGIGGRIVRRFVELNCHSEPLSFRPFYMYKAWYPEISKKDRLRHDQGQEGTTHDTGLLLGDIPGDAVEVTWCARYVAYWFDESICIEDTQIENIYYHFWSSKSYGYVGWYKSRNSASALVYDNYSSAILDGHSIINYDIGVPGVNDEFYLETNLLKITPAMFTDNDIYELSVVMDTGTDPWENNNQSVPLDISFPSVICNRSFNSFVLFNVPDNATLNESYSDTDVDGISDWTELYITNTNPFLFDTDADGASDLEEVTGEDNGYWDSDPNDFIDTTYYRNENLVVNAFGPYNSLINQPIDFKGSVSYGESPYTWLWDFGDGSFSEAQNPTHIYNEKGSFPVILTVMDNEGSIGNDSTLVFIEVIPPDTPSRPSGPISGKIGVEHTYTSLAVHPNGEDVAYLFDWGNGTYSEWTEFVSSGSEGSASHVWDEQGDYEIRVKAKNGDGAESEWSDPLPITIPKNNNVHKLPLGSFIESLFQKFPRIYQIIYYFAIIARNQSATFSA